MKKLGILALSLGLAFSGSAMAKTTSEKQKVVASALKELYFADQVLSKFSAEATNAFNNQDYNKTYILSKELASLKVPSLITPPTIKGDEEEKNVQRMYTEMRNNVAKTVSFYQTRLALHYFTGRGTTQNAKQGIYWIKQALKLDSNNYKAMSILGSNYVHGNGIKKDIKKGVSLIEKSCRNGEQSACTVLNEVKKYD